MLAAAGMTAAEEVAYRVLVARPACSPADLAGPLGLETSQAEAVLHALVAKGLASRTAENPPQFMACPPESALEPLLLEQQDQLRQAQLAVRELSATFASSQRARSGPQLLELVTGERTIGRRFEQIQRSAREEMLGLVRPPFTVPPQGHNDTELTMLGRGLSVRTLYDRAMLDEPDFMAGFVPFAEAGEEVRIVDEIPVKALIVDRSVAFLPIEAESVGPEPTFALLRGTRLLDALVALFELLWARATPLDAGATRAIDGDGLGEDDRMLLSLLLAGATDEAAARHLDVSLRTVERRIRNLMDRAGARNRMHLGWAAAVRGWLPVSGR